MRHKTCRRCGSHTDVDRGLCAVCQSRGREQRHPQQHDNPDLEPPRDRPWVPRSAFAGRKRRSPRA